MSSVPIWPGSSSFATVSASYYNSPSTGSRPTAFGYYDADTIFKVEADKFADYCARFLGYPIMDVELQDLNFFAAFEEATSKFSTVVNMYNAKDYILSIQGNSTDVNLSGRTVTPNLGRSIAMAATYGEEAGSGGDVDWKRGRIAVSALSQSYDLNTLWAAVSESGDKIEIKRVFHNEPPAIVRYFDPQADMGNGSNNMLEGFGWGSYSPAVSFLVMPIYADLLRMQAIEMNDQIRRSTYSFEIHNNKVTLFPIPTANYTLFFDYIVVKDRNNVLKEPTGSVSDLANAPYDRIQFGNVKDIGVQWIYEYGLGSVMVTLGLIRGKYTTIPIPGSEATLNGADLIAQGTERKMTLLTDLKEILVAMSRDISMVAEASIATSLQQTLAKVPTTIYIK